MPTRPATLLSAGLCILTTAATLYAAAPATAAQPPAPAPAAAPALHPRTRADLDTSLRGEAFAHASYVLFSAEAASERLPGVSRLYHSTAMVELTDHFATEAQLIGLVGSDAANLRAAISGESYEATTLYPAFARRARANGDRNAAALFAEIARDEAGHARAFRTALTVLETGRGHVPAPPPVTPVPVRPGPPKVSSPRTLADLNTAMHGEALAHNRYVLDADHAAKHGNAALSRLFHGTAMVELHEHFTSEAALAGLVSTTRTNLRRSIAGELYEARTMYPLFARRAAAVGDTAAALVFRHDARDEANHATAFQNALNHPS